MAAGLPVTITKNEAREALYEGGERQLRRTFDTIKSAYGKPPEPWRSEIEGAGAERALAKVFGIYLAPSDGAQRRGAGDVGPFQVRWVTAPGLGLILHDNDADDARFFLVEGSIVDRRYRIVATILGADGKTGAARERAKEVLTRSKGTYLIDQGDSSLERVTPKVIERLYDEVIDWWRWEFAGKRSQRAGWPYLWLREITELGRQLRATRAQAAGIKRDLDDKIKLAHERTGRSLSDLKAAAEL